MTWHCTFDLDAHTLRTIDPLPLIMQQLTAIDALREHQTCLYTILAELVTNAVDYGVLGLDATLKNSFDGFVTYYTTRGQALTSLQQGWLKITLDYVPQERGGSVVLRIVDSGVGFDYHRSRPTLPGNTAYHGRGIPLVRSLCTELVYQGCGNCVEAVYAWEGA